MILFIFLLLSYLAFGNLNAEVQQLKKTNNLLNQALEEVLGDDRKSSTFQNADNSRLSHQNRALTKALEELKAHIEEAVEISGDSESSIFQNAEDRNSRLSHQNRALTKAFEELNSENEENVRISVEELNSENEEAVGISGSTLYPGDVLQTNAEMASQNGNCYLKMQDDGNLVLYRTFDQKEFWSTKTSGNGDGFVADFQKKDGNFVVKKGSDVAWATNVYDLGATRLTLQDDGNLVVYNDDKALWSTGTSDQSACVAGHRLGGPTMYPGDILQTHEELYSANGNCYLKMQEDGNLVLYRTFDHRDFWSTQTNGNGNGYYADFQKKDGNFVVRKGSDVAWASNVYNLGATRLTLQDDGNIVVYKNDKALWSSGTNDRRACVTGAFDVVMASDPQYDYGDCSKPDTTTSANYALADQNWCKSKSNFWRTNNLMNGIWDSLGEERTLTGKPIGANIIGDLTNTATDGQEKAFARKVYDIEHDGTGPETYRIWQSMGNHDVTRYSYKRARNMVGLARDLVKNSGSGSYHDKGLWNKWSDGFCGDPESASYVYKKNNVAFINLQLAPNAYYVRLWPHKHTGGLVGPSGWLIDLLDGKNDCFSLDGIKGVFLMYHYPDACNPNDDPPTDCGRWNDVADAIERFNNKAIQTGSGYGRIMATFSGHWHKYSGYSSYSKLDSLPGNIHRFICGGLEFDTYLDVEVYPDGANPYYVVFSNAVDPSEGKPDNKHATGFKRRCINQKGKSNPKCTRWNFDGTTCEESSTCIIASNDLP